MENRDTAPPSTPYYNKSLDLPGWNEGLKNMSPNLPRQTPAKTPWKLGPPQRTPQTTRPNTKTPAMAASAQRLPCGRTPANTPVHGMQNAYMGSTHTPTLSSMPNALHAEWWLTRAKAKEENGDILGALGVLENALRRNARPLTPISKAINELQSQISKPRDGASNPTPIKLWSSVRPPAEQMKKTLRFASQLEEVAASADVDKEQQANSTIGDPKHAMAQGSETEKNREKTTHVRFCTPAPLPSKTPKSPMPSRSSNAGSTPYHSSGGRQRLSDFSDDSDCDEAGLSDSGSPTTVSRRLLEPILQETIKSFQPCKTLQSQEGNHEEGEDEGPADSHISESDCMADMHRYMLRSDMSPTSGALKVPYEVAAPRHAGSGAPCTEDADEEVSPLSGEIDLDQGRTPGKHFSFDNLIPAATPDLNLQATPCLRARPTTAPKGDATPSVCINPLYASTNTPSTAGSDAPNTAQYTPADPLFYATPARGTAAASATPLLSAVAANTLFSGGPIAEEDKEEVADWEEASMLPEADAVIQEQAEKQSRNSIVEPASQHSAAAGGAVAVTQEESGPALHSQGQDVQEESSDVTDSSAVIAAIADTCTDATGATAYADVESSGTLGNIVAQQEGSPMQQLSAAPRRAFPPRTPASAVRRSRLESDDAPTPIRNPLRIATPARARPRVGKSEIRGLLQDPHAPSPAQAAAMGSRNALSPMRADPKTRSNLGHAQLVTPKRRSARKLAPPQPTGAMLAGTGFAYAPNAALAGRLASAADGRKLALGDAMDADMLASMDEVAGQEGSPVFLDASQLEDLASALGSVSLTPTLQATSRSASTTPQSSMGAIASFMPTPTDGDASAQSEMTPDPLPVEPQPIARATRSALRNSRLHTPPGARKEHAGSEDEGTPSFKEAQQPPPPAARVTRSAAKAQPQAPVSPAQQVPGNAAKPDSKAKRMSPTESGIRHGLRRSTRLA